jgi:hypothetical protein
MASLKRKNFFSFGFACKEALDGFFEEEEEEEE